MTEENNPLDAEVISALRELQGDGEPDILIELGQTFIDDARQSIQKMAQSQGKDDATGLQRAAHSLKSSSASMGAMKMSSLCRELDMIARSGNLTGSDMLIKELQAEFQRVQASLEKMIQ